MHVLDHATCLPARNSKGLLYGTKLRTEHGLSAFRKRNQRLLLRLFRSLTPFLTKAHEARSQRVNRVDGQMTLPTGTEKSCHIQYYSSHQTLRHSGLGPHLEHLHTKIIENGHR